MNARLSGWFEAKRHGLLAKAMKEHPIVREAVEYLLLNPGNEMHPTDVLTNANGEYFALLQGIARGRRDELMVLLDMSKESAPVMEAMVPTFRENNGK